MSNDIFKDDIEQIKKIGFVFSTEGHNMETQDFISKYFPGFDLLTFLKELSILVESAVDTKLSKTIDLSFPPPEITIQLYTPNFDDPDHNLALSRIFTREGTEINVKHDYLSLPKKSRGKGLAKRILASCLKQYLKLEVKKILVYAALQDGGWLWAKVGFKATEKAEVEIILDKARKIVTESQFNLIARIFDAYYQKEQNGNAFPIEDWAALPFMKDILRGSDWHGRIDLTIQEELTNFSNYVA